MGSVEQAFIRTVKKYYGTNARDFPWRRTRDPYAVLVSEVMLQQTQAFRVVPKYLAFLKQFKTPAALAKARPHAVLALWQGLGYNRRALLLQRAAKHILLDHDGQVPKDTAALLALPGVGVYTASAVQAFAFGIPTVLIETNVRTAYIHHFFKTKKVVPDAKLQPLIEATLDRRRPRQWWNAVMDYGAFLKGSVGNVAQRSSAYKRQSVFKGSRREARGRILSALLLGRQDVQLLKREINSPHFDAALSALHKEGIVKKTRTTLALI